MEAVRRNVGNAVVLDVSGDVDMRSSPALREELQGLTGEEAGRIVVNLGGVSYIDSSGIATLVECMQRVSEFNGVFRLYGVGPIIRDVDGPNE